MDIRARFTKLASSHDDEIRLDEAALLIAAEADEFDVDEYLLRLDRLATNFSEDERYKPGLGISINALINYLHHDIGFSGNVDDYYDPCNSYLNKVIDSQRGIPITLALIHISMGSRLGIPVEGISFPGHFLVRYGNDTGNIVDPFSGRELSRADCQNLLRQIAGPRAALKEEYFQSAKPREILIRMLDNLKQIFWRNKAWDESKSCIDRQLLLLPEHTEFTIQLGAVYEMQGNRALAQHTYTQVLQDANDETVIELASKRLLALEGKPRVLH